MNKEELLEYIKNNRDKVNVYRCTGPAEHWLTAYVKGVWGFNREPRNHNFWKNLREGNILVFHSSNSKFNINNPLGIIGCGIVKDTYVKEGFFWHMEYENQDNSWPYIVTFSDMFFFGDMEKINKGKFINEKSNGEIKEEIEALSENLIRFNEIKENVIVKGSHYNFPVQGSASGFAIECEDYLFDVLRNKEIIQVKEEDVQYIPPEIEDEIKSNYEISKEIDQIPKEKQMEYINKKIEELSKEAQNITEPKERLVKHKQRFNKLKPWIKKKFNNKCQFCDYTFMQKNGQNYSEVCHIIPWNKSHDDSAENLLVLCPNHHKEFDLGDKKIRQKIISNIKEKFPNINYKFKE